MMTIDTNPMATAITSQGLTSVARNSVAETAMETILQDVDGMIVN